MKIKPNLFNELKEKFLFMGALGISIFLFFFVIACSWIGYDIKSQCREAKEIYGGDCIEALTKTLDDEKRDFRTRNYAIWALGQLGDKRALPILEKYYTGDIPEREPLNKVVSQYELKKAIKLASGGLNITSLFWKWNLDK